MSAEHAQQDSNRWVHGGANLVIKRSPHITGLFSTIINY